VVTATRLLIAAGGVGGFAAVVPAISAITTAPNAGWTQITGPHAVYHAGYTYLGYVDGSGNVEVVARVDGGPTGAAVTLHATLDADLHVAPSLWVRDSDHKLIAIYTRHDADATLRWRISTNSLDSDPTLSGGFASEATTTIGATSLTYPSIGQLGGDIYVTLRDYVSGTTTGSIIVTKSTDGGATWSAKTVICTDTGVIEYVFAHFGPSRIDLAISSGNGVNDANVNVYHLYFDGSWHKSDGTLLTLPVGVASLTKVYDHASLGSGWPTGVAIDATGKPVVLYETVTAPLGNSKAIRYARWNGSSWDNATVASLNDSGLPTYSHSALDESDPANVYTVEPVSGVFEAFKYQTHDRGATFVQKQLTSASAADGNGYPVNVHDRGPDLRALWLGGGSFTDYLTFNIGSRGTSY
jgi:hypothetical protein